VKTKGVLMDLIATFIAGPWPKLVGWKTDVVRGSDLPMDLIYAVESSREKLSMRMMGRVE